LTLEQIKTPFCHKVLIYLQTNISFCHNARVSQTDGQTDRQTDVDSKSSPITQLDVCAKNLTNSNHNPDPTLTIN